MRLHVGKRATAIVAALFLSQALSGCDQFKKGFDDGFNKSWAKQNHDSCVKAAQSRGPADMVERYCTCVVNQLMPLSTSQKMALKETSPELAQAAATCNAQAQQQQSTYAPSNAP